MEEQIKHKAEDLKQEEESKREKMDTKYDDAALKVPPRFKFIEQQIKVIKEDLKQEEPHAEEQTELTEVATESTTLFDFREDFARNGQGIVQRKVYKKVSSWFSWLPFW